MSRCTPAKPAVGNGGRDLAPGDGRDACPDRRSRATADAAARLVAEALEHFGRLDILVNNAGIIRRKPAAEHDDELWDEVLAVNLSSVFRLCRAAGRTCSSAARAARSSTSPRCSSFQGGITVPGYAAAKGGVVQLTKALANEWAPHGINVNAIAPGYMETDNTTALRADATRRRQITERIPAGRWGTARRIWRAPRFFSRRQRPTTSTATCWSSTAAGWGGRDHAMQPPLLPPPLQATARAQLAGGALHQARRARRADRRRDDWRGGRGHAPARRAPGSASICFGSRSRSFRW